MQSRARTDRLADAAQRLRSAVLGPEAVAPPSQRHAAYRGQAVGPVGDYVVAVREHAYRITDADIAALRDQGLSDDAIFELTVAAALGAADRRLAAGLALLGREAGF